MAAAEQLKSLIRSFSDGNESAFYATAMQIAATEAKKGHRVLADELRKLIDKAKAGKGSQLGVIKTLPINSSQKELNDLLELVHSHVYINDMVLDDTLLKSLNRILDEQRKLDLLLEHNLKPRKKLLFTGPPGCGKTMAASMLASELGIPLFIIRMDGLLSRYMGESISKLRLIFDAMTQFRAVYLFDEFDSIGTTRSGGNEVGEIKRVLNSFLLQIEKDNSNSIVIAATNLPETLDIALFRRFDDIIKFQLPNKENIERLFKLELADFKPSKKYNFKLIAQNALGLSYSEIHKICEDLIKEFLIYGPAVIDQNRLIEYASNRKQPY